MFQDEIQRICPFSLKGVVWRSVKFQHISTGELLYRSGDYSLRIVLPEKLQKAVPKRQAEYLAGRLCAADALRFLGLQEYVGMNGRLPVWPSNVVGSISHTDNYAIAAVSTMHAALGVDCEIIMSETQAYKLHHLFLSATEAEKQPSYLSFPEFVTLTFSAKEAFYKGIFTQINRVLEFSEVLIHTIKADVLQLIFEGRNYSIYWQIREKICLTLFTIPVSAISERKAGLSIRNSI